MELDPATAAYQKHGYNELPVEARLGPHRFRIPANYFYDQIGPDFQGGMALSLQWPDLQPLPPGKNFHDDMQTFYKAIGVHPRYIDRVPIDAILNRATGQEHGWGDPTDPNENLELRIKGDAIYGLTPYFADLDKLEAHFRASGTYTNRERLLAWAKDWYLAHDAQGRLATVIKCDSRERPDGLAIRENQVVESSQAGNALCDHEMVIHDEKISVSISYSRIFLKDWKAIEERVRDIFTKYRAR